MCRLASAKLAAPRRRGLASSARLFATRLAAITLALTISTQLQAAYLNMGEWRASLGGLNAQVEAMPSHSILSIEDNVGSYTPATIGEPVLISLMSGGTPDRLSTARLFTPQPTPEAGRIGGNFACVSFAWPCLGAHTLTYRLPFEIIGLAGLLDYRWGYSFFNYDAIPIFDLPPPTSTSMENARGFNGFWASDIFAPTDTLTIIWPSGIANRDDFASFRLSDAMVVRVPAPASLALFGAALLGLLGIRRALLARAMRKTPGAPPP